MTPFHAESRSTNWLRLTNFYQDYQATGGKDIAPWGAVLSRLAKPTVRLAISLCWILSLSLNFSPVFARPVASNESSRVTVSLASSYWTNTSIKGPVVSLRRILCDLHGPPKCELPV